MVLTSPFQPPKWKNNSVLLYHGTVDTYASSICSSGVDISKGKNRTDFGQGFYTTTKEIQARTWAWGRSKLTGDKPSVIRFEVDREELAALEILFFVLSSYECEDFWSFIFHCRNGNTDHKASGKYDVVVGPVSGIWRKRISFTDADQVSFHTIDAETILNKSKPKII